MTTKKKTASSSKKTPKKAPRKKGFFRRLLWWCLIWGAVGSAIAVLVLDGIVRAKFEGAKWALPAHVYGRPLDLYAGQSLSLSRLKWELDQLGYRQVSAVASPGQYRLRKNRIELYSRPFRFWDKDEPGHQLTVSFNGTTIHGLKGKTEAINLVRLESMLIGGIYPDHHEDRVLVTVNDVPSQLAEGLLAVEDQHFYKHLGISVKGIARAAISNMKAGGAIQGGSTITQQLVKNFYLTQERSLWRKGVEAVMAVLLEVHYSKKDILEAYLNEVFLGQSGKRAIHGFGLASRHYFRQPIGELELHKSALLIGMVKGASFYAPWRNPKRATARRNTVLDVMAAKGVASQEQVDKAKKQPLDISERPGTSANPYPAYLELVKQQLRRDYRDEDLSTAGLRIFTHFDPQVQYQVEKSVSSVVNQLEKRYKLKGEPLEAATVMVRIGTADVLAVAGSRKSGYAGYNRAIDARRQVGSTIKPAVYLSALEQSSRYTLGGLIDDSKINVKAGDGSVWSPKNYKRTSAGLIPLYHGLGHSLNQATVRLGMDVGLDQVTDSIRRLGFEGDIEEVPSMLLGTTAMTPLEVASLYHTIAAEGFYTPLRAIRAVYNANNQPLKRYPFKTEQRFSPQVMHLLQYAMQVVMREGTGKSVYNKLPSDLAVAGKTGTTNSQRDSWFSGFSGDYVGVVWVGRDDNGKTPLTGASGALKVWADIMAKLDTAPVAFLKPQGVTYHWIEKDTGKRSSEGCANTRYLPYIDGSEPQQKSSCYRSSGKDVIDWIKDKLGL